MIVSDLWRYPVKSLRGEPLREAEVRPWGISGDRRWMVVDPSGEKLWAGEHHDMVTVSAARTGQGLRLRAGGRPDLHVDEPVDGPPVEVRLRGVGHAVSAGDPADAWLSEALGRRVRLVWLADPARRPMSEAHGGRPGDVLSFADAAPLLLATLPSLRQLDDWIAQNGGGAPLEMSRFRPNLVIDGDLPPFAEDTWNEVQAGEVRFRFAEHCDRCAVTTLDPATGRSGKEPIRTLARHRRWDGQVWFGIRVVPLNEGTITVGDPVRAEGTRSSR
ncbi:molybdenum cofactor biosysynthesis protein [Actinoplanes ianthinogenes]|uniref:Molybdenum cofactor biosysynthesis protein n=1 Tax=Actinoplanes ianthinogenes TaxID=122358 RepID=A0ABM7M722_9ACTN|nr:MOSC N-terminal beta barrel domain-containing protein [Actinoplanes ianthinogenes]BCJ47390.1 molybdenum cofactor biosysynthesis protein [Actinoplanes ianthinogenes]GGR01488.1 molybdenum cofactor biosysynthesis protein [Actinoplanes ianthinogenes]